MFYTQVRQTHWEGGDIVHHGSGQLEQHDVIDGQPALRPGVPRVRDIASHRDILRKTHFYNHKVLKVLIISPGGVEHK